MSARTLMIQGTGSDAGKSALVTGLCRLFRRRGYHVAPFKPQNMALNSAVTVDGGEIGRAQAVQAQAAGVDPHSDMNPVLLKPGSDTSAQVIVQGQVVRDLDAAEFHGYKPQALRAVLASYRRLSRDHQFLFVEGAGSPAEINLREGDIANMGFAEAVDCPVILIADIDRGGVFAQLVGTLELLSPSERARIRGFVINRFRGDLALLQPGLDWLEQRTGIPVLGVIPYLHDLHLEAEDAICSVQSEPCARAVKVVVPVLPHISNHTDFDPLRLSEQVDLSYVAVSDTPPPADLVVLPGSKNVRADLNLLKAGHWPAHLQRHLRYGGKILGICGGFQMLGSLIEDPLGVEGSPGTSRGLGLLEMVSRLEQRKQLRQVSATLLSGDVPLSGYEIHMGESRGRALEQPLVRGDGWADGGRSDDDLVRGTYIHGLFENDEARQCLMQWVMPGLEAGPLDYRALRDAAIDRLADALEQQLDIGRLDSIIGV